MKLLHSAFSGIVTLAIIVLLFLAYGSVNNRFYRVITVEGNSMAPTLWYGDMMVVTPPTEDIALNSIVLMNISGSLVTHRVVGFDEAGQPITKGDANAVVDKFNNPDIQIVGIYRLRLPWFGYPILYLSRLLGRA